MLDIFINLCKVYLTNHRNYQSSSYSCIQIINKHNLEPKKVIEHLDFFNYCENKGKNNFSIEFQIFSNTLNNKEFNTLNSSINEILKDKTNIYGQLLYKVELGYNELNLITKDKKSFKKIRSNIYFPLSITNKKKIHRIQQKFSIKFRPLKLIKSTYRKKIINHLNLNIKNNKKYFYFFILDFIADLIENMNINQLEIYYKFYVEELKLNKESLHKVYKTIDLLDIFSLFTKCISQEVIEDTSKLKYLQSDLQIVENHLMNFYKYSDDLLELIINQITQNE